MTAATLTPPPSAPPALAPAAVGDGLFRLTLDQYHRRGELGILTPDDRVELLDGILVSKPMKNPAHSTANELMKEALGAVLPAEWRCRVQEPITLDDCEPEPDVAVVRGTIRTFRAAHPTPKDVAILVEVSDSTLGRDREWKRRIYARNAIPAYWIVNLVENTVEVFTDPAGPTPDPDYATARTLKAGDILTVTVDGATVGTVAVADILPG